MRKKQNNEVPNENSCDMHWPPYVDAMKLFSHPVNDCEEHWHIHIHHPLELQNNLKHKELIIVP